jgi:CDP-glucose 4,6-dehydratase
MSSQHSNQTNVWQGRSVLVTGCTGLLGSAMTRNLVDLGANVVGLIRDTVPRSGLFTDGTAEQIIAVKGDVREQFLIERVLNEYNIQVVFHLAAQSLVGTANRSPVETLDVNVKGTWSVLEAVRRTGFGERGVQAVMVASSDKAYGSNEKLPYTEETALKGQHPYDVSKSCADLITQCFAHTYNMPLGVTRCGNLFGGGDLNWNRIVPGTMRSIIEGTSPLIRSDGTMTRDYLYIEDGVNAYLTFAAALMQNPKLSGKAFNFGNNRPLKVLELVDEILTVAGRQDIKPTVLGEANNEIPEQFLDSSLAGEVLGWKPEFSLADGLKSTFEWYQKYFSIER